MTDDVRGTRERWQRIEQIYRETLERDASGRRALLDEACAGDAALRHEVESLMACEPAAAGFIESPALQVAADMWTRQADADLVGRRIGPYVVEAWLGAGGMGDVYRARDANLQRDVALKILPDLFAIDPDRLARFKREAQVLASLNHPNIAAIHGFEESNGVQALVLELVDGPTLADRIAQGSIPVDEALPIARQIAEGLEAAHEQGIVHRDLKPSNIKLRADGTVKVLDFGLAKVLQPQVVLSDESTAPRSPSVAPTGVILGTAAYMSPEQAKGRPEDKRSDVWAFGVVLFEMLSGQPAFTGESTSEIVASVLHHEIDWNALPTSTPDSVRRLIVRCLDRDVTRRLRDIGEARIVLGDPQWSLDESTAGDRLRTTRRRSRLVMAVAAAVLSAAMVGGGLVWYLKPSPASPITRLAFVIPSGQSISLPANRHLIDLSPDGSQLVYVANGRLFIKSMADIEPHAIPGTEHEQALSDPTFSPDGQSVAFYAVADQAIKRISVNGGGAVTVCHAEIPYGIDWQAEGILVGQGRKGILLVSPDGGPPETLVHVNGTEEAHGPHMLPDKQHVLFTLATGIDFNRWEKARVVVQSLASNERKTLINGATDARYVETGHLVYALGPTLFAVPFDAVRLEVTGGPVAMVEGVLQSAGRENGGAQFAFSKTGSLAYAPGGTSGPEWGQQELLTTDQTGRVELLKLPPGPYRGGPRASPDGKHITFGTDDGDEAIVYTYDLSGDSPMRRLTFGGRNRFPIWSADGRHVAFQSDRDGDEAIFWQAADGNGTAERLTKAKAGEAHAPESWSPDGATLLFSVTKGIDISLWTLSLADRKVALFGEVHSSYPPGARFSPDGRWVAYTQSEAAMARMAIYVQPFPATGVRQQLFVKESSATTSNSPHKPAWSPDGRQLFYIPRLGGFEVVNVTAHPTFAFGHAVPVIRSFAPGAPNSRTLYDVTSSGQFLGLRPAASVNLLDFSVPRVEIVLNWSEELKRLVPTR